MQVKEFTWNLGKNTKLKEERGVSFEDVRDRLESGAFQVRRNRSRNHPGQKIYVIMINRRRYAIPFEEHETHIFLKTIFEVDP